MPAKENVYIKRAYDVLEEISADEQKRIEYNTRQKWLYDYNTMMEENLQRGINIGEERGIAIGEERGKQQGRDDAKREMLERMKDLGYTEEQIRQIVG